MIVLGPSFFGKTDWVLSLFTNPLLLVIGTKNQFPALTRTFRREEHDGIVLDDVRDLQFLLDNQDKLQGKYNAIAEFGTTPSDEYAYHHYLNGVPIAVTVNKDTKNLEFLQPGKSDWLGQEENRVFIELKEKTYGPPEAAPTASASSSSASSSGAQTQAGESAASESRSARVAGAAGMVRQLQELTSLKENGYLTEDEFAAAKKQVLGL